MWYSNSCTMTHILTSKVHILHYTNPSNLAECKVAVTKIVSLLWVLADVDLQKQYKSALEKAICSYFHVIICPSKSPPSNQVALMDLRSHPHLSRRSCSLGYFVHVPHHLNYNFLMRKASRYKKVNFTSIYLQLFGRRLNDILQELHISAGSHPLQPEWSRPA